MRTIMPYLFTLSLVTPAYAQNLGSLSQRAVELSEKAADGCVTEYGTMKLAKIDGGERIEFRKDSEFTGFERKSGVFTFFMGNGDSTTRYVTIYPQDEVSFKAITPSKTPPVMGVPAYTTEWTAEYKGTMGKFVNSIEKCPLK